MRQLGLLIFCWILSIPVLSSTPDTIQTLKQELLLTENDSQRMDALLNLTSTFNLLGLLDSSSHYLEQAKKLIIRAGLSSFSPDLLVTEASLLKEYNQLDSAESKLNQGIILARKDKRMEVLARAINILGQVFHIKGNYGQALQTFKESRELYADIGDSLKVAGLDQNIAIVLSGMGLSDRAVEYYFSSLRIIERIGTKQQQAILLNNIGHSLDEQGDNEAAIRYLTKAIEISKEIDDRSTLSMSYLNLANLYMKQEDYKSTLHYFELAEKYLPTPPPVGRLARISYNRGSTYYQMDDLESAEMHFTACLNISTEAGLLLGVGNALMGLAQVSLDRKEYAKALAQITESIQIADMVGELDFEIGATQIQYIIYKEMGSYKDALKAAERHFLLKDSVLNIHRTEAISRIQATYETEKKEQENLMLLSEKKHNEALLEAQSYTIKKQYWAVGIVSFAVVLMGVALSLFFIQKKRLRKALEILSLQNEELNQTREELQELNATKDRFFSIIAHDLKSPFTALLGFTAIMEEEADTMQPERRQRIVRDFRQAVQATYDLLENLLAWAENQRGTLRVEPVRFNLEDLTEASCHIQLIRAKAKGIVIRKEIDPECEVWADVKLSSTVMRNLLSNAIKFSHSGNEILIRCEAKDGKAIISIIDQGVGIEPSILKDLFRLDKRTSQPGTKNETGTGLGLIMCKEFVEMQGGTINLLNKEEGRGTIATFTLPLAT